MEIKKIKIFVDGHVFDREYQGTQTFLKGLYTALISYYPQLDIYFGAQRTESIQNNFPNFPLENILTYKKRRFNILRLIIDIPDLLKKHQFDFAHFQYVSPIKTKNCQYIVTTHDLLFNDFKTDFSLLYRLSRNFLFRRSIRNAAIKTTVSNYSKQQISTHYQIPLIDINIIPNGIEAEEKNSDAVKRITKKYGFKNYILCVSRIEPRKNHALLLKKYLKLKLDEQGIPLVFVGKKSIAVKALDELIQGLSDTQRRMFYWIDQANASDLEELYIACRFFVYPSKAEGFGIPPIEAAIHNCAILCSSATAMKDFKFFEPYTFDPNNENEFEQKLALMVQYPPTEAKKKEVAQYIVQKYNWQESSNLFYQLLAAKR